MRRPRCGRRQPHQSHHRAAPRTRTREGHGCAHRPVVWDAVPLFGCRGFSAIEISYNLDAGIMEVAKGAPGGKPRLVACWRHFGQTGRVGARCASAVSVALARACPACPRPHPLATASPSLGTSLRWPPLPPLCLPPFLPLSAPLAAPSFFLGSPPRALGERLGSLCRPTVPALPSPHHLL